METFTGRIPLMSFPSQGLALVVFVGFGFIPLVSNGAATHRQLSREKLLLCNGLVLQIQGTR